MAGSIIIAADGRYWGNNKEQNDAQPALAARDVPIST